MTFRNARLDRVDDLLRGPIRAGDAIRDRRTREVVADERHLRQPRHAYFDRRRPVAMAERELRNRLIPSEAADHRRRRIDLERALQVTMRDGDDLVVAQRCDRAVAAAPEK